MNGDGEQKVVLGPLFTLGVGLVLAGLLRRRKLLLALGGAALVVDRTSAGRKVADSISSRGPDSIPDPG